MKDRNEEIIETCELRNSIGYFLITNDGELLVDKLNELSDRMYKLGADDVRTGRIE